MTSTGRPLPPRSGRSDASLRRLVVVSHRLPVAIDGAGETFTLRRTVGGLASGIEAFLSYQRRVGGPLESAWIGWPGIDTGGERQREATRLLEEEGGFGAVPLDASTHALFYDGFSNRALWPMCHSFPGYVHLEDREWDAYREVNLAFCEAVLRAVGPGDAVWIHDFHLMLLPALLRARVPDLAIAYFHHTPFPSLDILRVLPDPWARELLSGLLGADLVGFHTHDDVRKFVRASERLLGLDTVGGEFTLHGRVSQVDAFPISVDFAFWNLSQDDPAVQAERQRVRTALAGGRIVLSIDRLDYTKGILNRLLAFERLLAREPQWRNQVTLLMVAVPSRVGVEAYRTMRKQIEEAVGRINGQYGSLAWTPVQYQFRALDRTALAALYLEADVALVTPLRDGMNLVAKEFLAARRDERAVLVLSDTAGAARELGEALLVNPFHVEGLTDALHRALEMPPAERRRRCRQMRMRLARYDAARWGAEQCRRLAEARARTKALQARHFGLEDRRKLVRAWQAASRRLLLLDYDGSLVPFAMDPSTAAPDDDLLALLAALGRQPGTTVVVLSGRDVATLGAWLAHLPVGLAAEHGARVRAPDGTWSGSAEMAAEPRRRALEVMQLFADRLPGSFVEEKDVSLAWHWRAADVEVGAVRAGELVEALKTLGVGPALQVIVGKRVVEARGASANKGSAARHWLAVGDWDLILAAGDDVTDEDLFAALPERAWSLRVGPGESRARFNVDGPGDLRELLGTLLEPPVERA